VTVCGVIRSLLSPRTEPYPLVLCDGALCIRGAMEGQSLSCMHELHILHLLVSVGSAQFLAKDLSVQPLTQVCAAP
jgi:hypothetical protein